MLILYSQRQTILNHSYIYKYFESKYIDKDVDAHTSLIYANDRNPEYSERTRGFEWVDSCLCHIHHISQIGRSLTNAKGMQA